MSALVALLQELKLEAGCWSWARPPTTQILPSRIHGWYDSDLLTPGNRERVFLFSDHLGPSRHGMDRGTASSWVTEREG